MAQVSDDDGTISVFVTAAIVVDLPYRVLECFLASVVIDGRSDFRGVVACGFGVLEELLGVLEAPGAR